MPKYICEHCGVKFTYKDGLTNHQDKSSYFLQVYTCSCGKEFIRKASLERHKLQCNVILEIDKETKNPLLENLTKQFTKIPKSGNRLPHVRNLRSNI